MMKFLRQRGAMFGLDARITLLIAGLVGMAVGFNSLSQVKSSKVEATRERMEKVKQSWLTFYRRTGGVPGNIADMTAFFDYYNQPIIEGADVVDAWGSSFSQFTAYQCNSDIPYYTVVVISPGPDGALGMDYVGNYDGDCDSVLDFDNMVQGDDLYLRFNTYDYDKGRDAQSKQQLQEIMQKLEALAAHNRIRWQRICESTGTGTAGCDYDANGTYVTGEELAMNFYPRDAKVVGGCAASRPFYADNASFARSFTSNNTVDMPALMTLLGLPTSYATDPVSGNTLKYDPNVRSVCHAPYVAQVWYR